MITVLIPAFNRPELLRNALISVSQQTAKHLIDSVIVSENGLNRGSEAVCAEFEDINIQYFYHEKQKPVLEHLQWVLGQASDGYSAMLCDDDWWDIHHIELAAHALIAHDECIAYFSNYTHAQDMHSLKGPGNYWSQVMHFSKERFNNFSLNKYSLEDVMILCLLTTPFHFSSMVCNTRIIKQAVSVFDEIHPAVADRLLWAKLSTYGKIIFSPLTTAIILRHSGQDSHNYNNQWQVQLQIGGFKVLEIASSQGIDVKSILNSLYKNSSKDDAYFIRQELSSNFFEVNNLSWFAGYSEILKTRREQEINLRKQKLMNNKVYSIAKRIGKKIFNI